MRTPIIISVSISLVFTLILMCFGVFGEFIAPYAITVALFLLKWLSIVFGYFLICFLPYRIIVALKKRDEITKQIIEENKKILQHNADVEEKEKEQKLEEKILQAYYKEKDEI